MVVTFRGLNKIDSKALKYYFNIIKLFASYPHDYATNLLIFTQTNG